MNDLQRLHISLEIQETICKKCKDTPEKCGLRDGSPFEDNELRKRKCDCFISKEEYERNMNALQKLDKLHYFLDNGYSFKDLLGNIHNPSNWRISKRWSCIGCKSSKNKYCLEKAIEYKIGNKFLIGNENCSFLERFIKIEQITTS